MPTVSTTIDLGSLPNGGQLVVAAVQVRNREVRDTPLSSSDMSYLGGLVSTGMQIRSAHGNRDLKVQSGGITTSTVFDLKSFPNMSGDKVKYAWMHYARAAATEHARGGIPTLIEFNGGSNQDTDGARVLYEYVRNLFLYTPDHYTTWYVVTHQGVPVKA